MAARLAWLTPDSLPAATTRRVFVIPDDPIWQANLLGCLWALAEPANHEQFGSVTPEQAAAVWLAAFESILDGETCPDP